eukprot:PLAT6601.1.p1 GENE.PLAT6601.1~~PLAT6601.1.p1  ORF type:complete len:183 (-),score=72.07 PLAT6601.1:51-536(-)
MADIKSDLTSAVGGVAGGTEEIWNQKELIRRMAFLLREGEWKDLPDTLARAGKLNDGFAARLGDDVAGWLKRFHGATFEVNEDGSQIKITESGLERYVKKEAEEVVELADPSLASESARVARDTVFEELRKRAEERLDDKTAAAGAEGDAPAVTGETGGDS